MFLSIKSNQNRQIQSNHPAFEDIRSSCIKELSQKGFQTDVYLLRGGVGVKLLNKDHPSVAQIAHLPIIEFDFDYPGEPSLDHLSFFPLQGLRLSQSNLASFSKLERFNLRKLHLDGVDASDFESLEVHPLIELSLRRTKVDSLHFLNNSAIELLYLSQTAINDQELEYLQDKPLKSVDLFKCPVSNLSPVCQENLEEIVISGSQVEDLTPLSECPLRKLEMRATKIESLTPLSNCPLEILHLPGSNITCIKAISYCPISELNLIGLKIADLSPLLNMPLQKLSISRNILNNEQIEILKQLDLRILHSPNDPLDQTPDEFFKNLDEDKNGE